MSDATGPFPLFAEWLPANDDPARPLMTLSTIASTGYPDARTVLLSEHDSEGLYFHTDSRSRKVADVTARPRAALTLVFPGRQLVVQGDVTHAPVAEEERAYARRSRYLQLLAWLNTDEFAALPRPEREALWAEYADAHPEGTLTPPDTWDGFLVRPVRVTFWEGDGEIAGRRTEFRRTPDDTWEETILAG